MFSETSLQEKATIQDDGGTDVLPRLVKKINGHLYISCLIHPCTLPIPITPC